MATIETNNLASKRERSQIVWRRNKVHEFLIKDYTQYDIVDELKISQPTISTDI